MGLSRNAHAGLPDQQRSLTMQHHQDAFLATAAYPWNKGKLVGPKPPLRPKHVWSIRTKLQALGRIRDLAIFNLAIDSKLRGCDVVATKVEDVAPQGYALERATVRQQKTGRSVRFELTEQTRQALYSRYGRPALPNHLVEGEVH
jgi:integrase